MERTDLVDRRRASRASPTAPRAATRSTASSPTGRATLPADEVERALRRRRRAGRDRVHRGRHLRRPAHGARAATSSPSTTRWSVRCASRRRSRASSASRRSRRRGAPRLGAHTREVLARARRRRRRAARPARRRGRDLSDGAPRSIAPDLFELDDDGGAHAARRLLADAAGCTTSRASRLCPYTGADDVEPARLPPTRHAVGCGPRSPRAPPGYAGPVPFGFGVVELDRRAARRHPHHRGRPGRARGRRCRCGSSPTWSRSTTTAPRWSRGRSRRRPAHDARVEIAGVGIHPFGRFEDRSVTDMGVHAVRAALAEAGNPHVPGRVLRHRVLRASPPATRCSARSRAPACRSSTSRPAARAAAPRCMLAAGAIRAGQYDCVLVFGIEKMPRGIIRSSFFEPWREEAGLAATPAYFALRAQRLHARVGLTKEHLAQVVVKNRAPRCAQPRRDVPQGGHRRGGARVARRVRAAAPLDALLAERGRRRGRAARAASRRRDGTVTLEAAVLRSHLPGQRARRGHAARRASTTTASRRRRTLAARAAYEEAGVGPDDVDVVECQDTDAARELLAWEELGLCARGEQAAILADGERRRSAARRPVNVSRRPAVEGRAARRVGARSGGRARAPAARRGRRPPGRRAPGSASRTPSAAARTPRSRS